MTRRVEETRRIDHGTRAEAKRRLQSVRGHLDGILRMLEDDATSGVDALKQIRAVAGGLEKVGALVLRNHLRRQVAVAAAPRDADAVVDEVLEVLKYR